MNNIKVIALDMDGTLLDAHQKITQTTQAVLKTLQKQGIRIVLASGRDLYGLKGFGECLDFENYPQSGYICLNGLEIYSSDEELLYHRDGLSYDDCLVLESYAQDYQFDMIFFMKDCLYIIEKAGSDIIQQHFISRQKYQVKQVQDIPQHYFQNIRKVAFVQKAEIMEKVIPLLQQKTQQQFDICRVEKDWVEVNPHGIHKGSALEKYAQIFGISMNEVMAFGNGENDIEMLKIAGQGVAMGNAFQHVKEIADDVCDDHQHDGIAKYLLQKGI